MITRRGLFAACVAAGVTACVGGDEDALIITAEYSGEFERGPIDQPIRIDTFEEFVHHFGGYEPEHAVRAAAVYAASPGLIRCTRIAIGDASI